MVETYIDEICHRFSEFTKSYMGEVDRFRICEGILSQHILEINPVKDISDIMADCEYFRERLLKTIEYGFQYKKLLVSLTNYEYELLEMRPEYKAFIGIISKHPNFISEWCSYSGLKLSK